MKIIADKNIPFLEDRIKGASLLRLPARDITPDAVKDADALIVRTRTRCDAGMLAGSAVRLVATATIGTDHVDIPWCEANGITVRNAPGSNAPGVALYVWASLLRRGFLPGKSVLGVVGCGHVGSIVADWGQRLGAEVLVCDPPRCDAGFSDRAYLPLEEVLAKCDALTLHTPLTRGSHYPTFHLIDAGKLGLMKKNSILVNAARGEVVDTGDVVKAMEEGIIGEAIIDTWEGEPDIDRRLLDAASVATCHIAGYSVEGKQRASRMALEAVASTLGLEVDLIGLPGDYAAPAKLDPGLIVKAFDPGSLTRSLKAHPEDFESLRNSYPLHKEL